MPFSVGGAGQTYAESCVRRSWIIFYFISLKILVDNLKTFENNKEYHWMLLKKTCSKCVGIKNKE